MTLNPYLNYGGNCKEAFAYYEEHLGGKITMMLYYTDAPGNQQPAGTEHLVMHARIEVGGLSVMASDMPPNVAREPMRSAYLNIGVNNDEEAERIHAALADGGKVFMTMQETFYAFKFSMLQDKFGINWMVIHERPMPS
jgi:PhnB protein